MQHISKLPSGWSTIWPDINIVIGDDAKIGCCGRECNTRTHPSLRGSVSFCSIECVLAMKFGGETRIHEIFKT